MTSRIARIGPYILGTVVRLGTHCETGDRVAIKIISKDIVLRSRSRGNVIEREIAVLKLLRHPNILKLIDVYESPDKLFLVQEFVSGGELFDLLSQQGVPPPDLALRLFGELLEGLHHCHSYEICHRDLKPENLLLTPKYQLKIADFGMAALTVGDLRKTSCGSPHYAAPEVVRGEAYDGKLADAWSCGVILYALFTARLPFDSPDMKLLLQLVKVGDYEMLPTIPVLVQDLIRRLLVLNPAERCTVADARAHAVLQPLNLARATVPDKPLLDMVKSSTFALDSRTPVDLEIVATISALGCDSPAKILTALASKQPSLYSTLYTIFLERKSEFLGDQQHQSSLLSFSSPSLPQSMPPLLKSGSIATMPVSAALSTTDKQQQQQQKTPATQQNLLSPSSATRRHRSRKSRAGESSSSSNSPPPSPSPSPQKHSSRGRHATPDSPSAPTNPDSPRRHRRSRSPSKRSSRRSRSPSSSKRLSPPVPPPADDTTAPSLSPTPSPTVAAHPLLLVDSPVREQSPARLRSSLGSSRNDDDRSPSPESSPSSSSSSSSPLGLRIASRSPFRLRGWAPKRGAATSLPTPSSPSGLPAAVAVDTLHNSEPLLASSVGSSVDVLALCKSAGASSTPPMPIPHRASPSSSIDDDVRLSASLPHVSDSPAALTVISSSPPVVGRRSRSSSLGRMLKRLPRTKPLARISPDPPFPEPDMVTDSSLKGIRRKWFPSWLKTR